MAFTDLDFLAHILDERWHADVAGRREPVPKPEIVIATTRDLRRISTASQDVIIVRDGGEQQIEPKGLSWGEESVSTPLMVDVRTSVDRARFVGIRDEETNESERYGGLYGETKRILQTIRKGEKEFTWAATPAWNDLSEDMGYGHWRGTWTVQLEQVATPIDPTPYPNET